MLIHQIDRFYFPDSPNIRDAKKWILQAIDRVDAITPVVRDWDLALDIGGFCGVWAHLLSEQFEDVITFEPIPENYACLVFNVPQQVEHHCLAIGNRSQDIWMRLHGGNFGHWERNKCGTHRARMETIDSMDLNPGFIKIDTDGSDLEVLQGAEETIMRSRPVICIEIKGSSDRSRDIRRKMSHLGYELHKKIAPDEVYIPC